LSTLATESLPCPLLGCKAQTAGQVSKLIVRRPAADKDIDSVFDYLKGESPRAAIKFLDAIEHAYEVIADHSQCKQ